ncbi:uncharacterized protein A4U43_C02F22810 [Asparagus officinalis]|uniref:Knotted 1-binding protein 36 n=1 Tax=Asparagus officinalis TaxID=4686 RepID=A0A5P1FL56_ASPOF|nr:uncharacterized protein LOC109831954 [Asparagus officinalis]XP_020255038.1 uncharacterized protein LOC109831954 [Asparagus officinalis]XP_020255039.1 uncharacterized protein LOC109831954 [Asparagus officinalis]XP_020255040.1 uncharacterized protein LOC109831954 [Asparagus officinalis]ONK78824.1 uncharacterized protein A4U43_C02F22810 [Asparagus officinalis]
MKQEMEASRKRIKTAAEGGESRGGKEEEEVAGGFDDEEAVKEEEETNEAAAAASEEMESSIQSILERIERFTHQVSKLLESGKEMFSNLSSQFEERLISIHRDQVEKWQEEIKELRLLDASNEAARSLLQNAQFHLFQSVTEENT